MARSTYIGGILGSGAAGSVRKARIDGKACALKMVFNTKHFANETRAYQAIGAVDELHEHVCRFEGTYTPERGMLPQSMRPTRLALRLQRLRGPALGGFIAYMAAAQRDELRQQLQVALGLMHTRAGVCHGDVKSDNIIVDEASGRARFIDFSHAVLRGDLPPRLWEQRQRRDLAALDAVFNEAASQDAVRAAAPLVARLAARNADDTSTDEAELAQLLSRIGRPPTALLASIQAAVPQPCPALALAVCAHIERWEGLGARRAALDTLRHCLAREREKNGSGVAARAARLKCARYLCGRQRYRDGMQMCVDLAAELGGGDCVATAEAVAELVGRHVASIENAGLRCELEEVLRKVGDGGKKMQRAKRKLADAEL